MPRQITLSWVEGEHGYLRPWPELQYLNGKVAARIESDEYYVPWRAACSEHKPIGLVILNHSTEPPKEEVVNTTFENMVLAKIWVLKFLGRFEDFIPSETRMTKKAFHNLFDMQCPICGMRRGYPNDHSKCSKILQQQQPNQPTEKSKFRKKRESND